MINVYLHGDLGKELGKEWSLNVNTVYEALAAIDANTDKLFSFFQENIQKFKNYQIVVDDEYIQEEEVSVKKAKKEINIYPVIEGSKKVGIMIAVAVLLIAAPQFLPVLTAKGASGGLAAYGSLNFAGNLAVSIGIGLLIQGITSAMTKSPSINEAKQSQSYLFQGNVNNEAQGQPVPIGYGRLRVGSQVIGVAQKSRLLGEGSYEDYKQKRLDAWISEIEGWLEDTEKRFLESIPEWRANSGRWRHEELVDFRARDNKTYLDLFMYKAGHNRRYDFNLRGFTNHNTIPASFDPDIG